MNLIIPMAGRGSRLRPHTLTTPKPLIKIAGQTIVERLVKKINAICQTKIKEIGFVIGDFDISYKKQLIKLAESIGSKGKIYHQKEALGTAHAIYCAKDSLKEKTIIAFADTLFDTEFSIHSESSHNILVKEIKDPSQFGVVKTNEKNQVTDFIEKPSTPISNLAIIGVYYFKSGKQLAKEIEYILDKNIKDKGEFQITTVLENMKNKGEIFSPVTVSQWLDCGNYKALLDTNKKILMSEKKSEKSNSKIISPVFIGNNVEIIQSTVGPYVSIEDNSKIYNSQIENSIIQSNTVVKNSKFKNSVIGLNSKISNNNNTLSVGDYSEIN